MGVEYQYFANRRGEMYNCKAQGGRRKYRVQGQNIAEQINISSEFLSVEISTLLLGEGREMVVNLTAIDISLPEDVQEEDISMSPSPYVPIEKKGKETVYRNIQRGEKQRAGDWF